MARLRPWPAALVEPAAVSAWEVHVVVVRVDPADPVARREALRDLAALRAVDLAQPLAARVVRDLVQVQARAVLPVQGVPADLAAPSRPRWVFPTK